MASWSGGGEALESQENFKVTDDDDDDDDDKDSTVLLHRFSLSFSFSH